MKTAVSREDAKTRRGGAEVDAAKALLKGWLTGRLKDKQEIGLADLARDLSNAKVGLPEWMTKGLFLAKMLNAVGWQRNGWMHTGYDRTPRYAPLRGFAASREANS